MQYEFGILSTIVSAIGIFWGIVGVYWAVEFARGTPQAGSYLWTCVFVAVLCSVIYWFDQRRLQDKANSDS